MLVLNSNLPSQRRSSTAISGGINMSMNMKSRFGANLSSDYSRPFAANEELGSTLPPPDNGDGSEENLQPIPVGDGSVVFAVLIGFYAAFIELRRRKM